MRVRTLVLLAAFVALFVGLRALRRRETGQRLDSTVQEALCPGLQKERVARMRVDHLERGIQIELERDARGTWFLTDPVAYRALDALVRTQIEVFERSVGERVPDADLRALGLDPPLVVLELDEQAEWGTRTFRVEIGKVDLDPDLVYVRVPSRAGSHEEAVFRTLRTIFTTLDRNPDDYRDRRATSLDARDVVGFSRRGSVFDPERGEEVELAFEAALEPEGWMCKDPPIVRLDPIAMGLMARGSAELEVETFADDAPRSFAPFGLDPPRFSIELNDAGGAKTVLHFGHPERIGPGMGEPGSWFARREGCAHVWGIEARDAKLLSLPADLLFDTLFLRAKADDVERVECAGEGRGLVLERTKEGWNVRESVAREEQESCSYRADAGAVQDVISLLEHLQLRYPAGMVFVPEDPPLSIAVTTKDGLSFGGRIGKPWRDTELGSTGFAFQRFGDERAGWIEEAAFEIARSPLERFRSHEIHRLRETDVRWLRIMRGGTEHAYVQAAPLEWIVQGTAFPAPKGLTNALEVLLAMEAEHWLDDVAPESLVDSLDLRVGLPDRELAFRLARAADGALLCAEDGHVAEVERSALDTYRENWKADLFETLCELFPE